MSTRFFFRSWLAPGSLLLLAASFTHAAEQLLDPYPRAQSAFAAQAIVIGLDYTTANPCDATLTGLGLRMHWDSSKLAFEGLSGLLQTGLIGQGEPVKDEEDADDDPTTDRFILVAWADIDAAWPGGICAGVRLFSAGFRTAANFVGQTTIGFSASSTAAGRQLVATPALVSSGPADSDGDAVPDARDTHPWDASLPVGELRLGFEPGLNLLGYGVGVAPVHISCDRLAEDLGGIPARQIIRIEPGSGRIEACDLNAPFIIAPGAGYALYSEVPLDLLLYDDQVCAEIELHIGTNLVAYTDPPSSMTCYDWLAELDAGNVSSIRHLHPIQWRFESCGFDRSGFIPRPAGTDFPIQAGEGYLLDMREPMLLRLGNCP